MIRDVLRMGDPRLLERSSEVTRFGTPELATLLADMRDTMRAQNGAGLAAPQIGVPLRVVIFGMEHNPRYPDEDPVPYTELVNPVLTPLERRDRGGVGRLPVRAGISRRRAALDAPALHGIRSERRSPSSASARISMPVSCSTSAIISTASCTRCASRTCASSASPTCSSRIWKASTPRSEAGWRYEAQFLE